MRVLVGYDGSKYADAALTDLKHSGLPGETEVLLLSAADVYLPPDSGPEEDEIFPAYVPVGIKLARKRARRSFDEARTTVEEAARKVRKMFSGWKVEAEAVADSPIAAIIAKAAEWKPDLLVVGSHGRTALSRLFLGSVSQSLLYEARCSVRIARGRRLPKNHILKIIIGTDFSADSRAMIDAVLARNWEKGTKVKLVTALETSPKRGVRAMRRMERAGDAQRSVLGELILAGLDATRVVTFEDPKHFLVRKAKEWNADCIFLGAKGRSLWERLTVGSVSSSVASRAHCSVEVVRPLTRT
jgi:nucleotide-binding universal stress UspA family protein